MTPPRGPAARRPPRPRDRTVTARLRRAYGHSPAHLVVLLASFAVCGYAAARLLDRDWFDVAKWIVLAAVLHDLVLVPLYGGADWLLHRALGTGDDGAPEQRTARADAIRIAVVNHVRVPAALSLLALLVYWPLISQGDNRVYALVTGLAPDVFLTRWLLVTATLFALSALVLCLRWWRWRSRRTGDDRADRSSR